MVAQGEGNVRRDRVRSRRAPIVPNEVRHEAAEQCVRSLSGREREDREAA